MICLMVRKHYTDEFRRQAVDLYESTEGATLSGIAGDLGLAGGTLAAASPLWALGPWHPRQAPRKRRGAAAPRRALTPAAGPSRRRPSSSGSRPGPGAGGRDDEALD